MSQPVKRACDACHRRKVKCDGIRPCKNCGAASLDCTYFAIPQKKGPKGSRAKVISELRETQRQTSLLAKVQSRMQTAGMGGLPAPDPANQTTAMTPGLLTPEVLKDCIDFYFKNVFPLAPILSRQRIENQAQFAEQNRDKDAYCLLTSLCAFILLQPGMGIPSADPSYPAFDMLPGANIIASQILVEETLRVRRGYEYLDSLSVDSVCTSYFLFACHYFMESHNKAWFNLREATTMAHMMDLHKEEKYANMPVTDAARQRRVYWHLFATERAYAIKRGRPLTLQATINPPSITDDPNEPLAHNLSNFVSMVNLFRPFDDSAAAVWSKTIGNLQQGQASNLQKQLHETVRQYMNQDQNFADMNISRSWLEWQLNNGLGNNNRAGFEYSNELAREMLTCMAQQFRGQEMEVSNSGLIQKLMGLTFHLFDFLSAQPPSRDLSTTSPQEHLSTITNMVALMRLNDYRFVPLLLGKVHDILPRLISPLLDSAPEDSPMANFDIFDGFGNSTISYMQPQMHMAMDMEQDRKFSVADYENMSPSVSDSASASGSGSSNGIPTSIPATVPTPTSVDMGSQYVTSPAATLMSPTVDYPHGLDFAACTPISEVVMSPLGHGPNGLGHSGAMNQQQTQQQQHHLLQNHGLNPQQLHSQSMGHNGLGQAQAMGAHQGMPGGTLPSSHPMMGLQRQGPQRTGSFAMPHSQHHQPPPIPRTVGDFQALQRANSDSTSMGQLAGMASLGPEMDFGGLR